MYVVLYFTHLFQRVPCLLHSEAKERVFYKQGVMALYENRDIQSQYYRGARLARERIRISESVEETLADTSSQEEWLDDEQKDVTSDSSPANIALVPPRLSLQSKELSSVGPATFVQSVTAELAAQQASVSRIMLYAIGDSKLTKHLAIFAIISYTSL